jgi:post-segregation antitoxin (ccd killing protein)
MARVNVYLPDDLAAAVKAADLNVSGVVRAALESVLEARDTDRWLDDVERLAPAKVSHADVVAAVRAARAELGVRDARDDG